MSVAKRVLANLRVFSVGQSIGLALDEDDADDDASPEPLALGGLGRAEAAALVKGPETEHLLALAGIAAP